MDSYSTYYFYVWLLPLNEIPMLLSIKYFAQSYCCTLLYEYTATDLFLPLLMEVWVASSLAYVNSECLWDTYVSFLLERISLRRRTVGHRISLCLALEDNVEQFANDFIWGLIFFQSIG